MNVHICNEMHQTYDMTPYYEILKKLKMEMAYIAHHQLPGFDNWNVDDC